MSTEQFNVMRKELVENVTGAALDWLAYMGAPAALAAIPDTDPPRYVVAGTLADIVKLLPAAEVIRPTKGITSLKDIPKYEWWLIEREGNEEYVKLSDVERLLASTAGEQSEVTTSLTGPELHAVYVQAKGGVDEGLVAVANAALRHAARQAAPAAPEQVPEGIASDVLQRVRDLLEGAAAWSAGGEAKKIIYAALDLLAAPIAAAPAAEEVKNGGKVE